MTDAAGDPPRSFSDPPRSLSDAALPAPGEAPDFSGMVPVEHFRQVLQQAAAEAPPEARTLLILTHRAPDPDAIGACVGVERLCNACFGIETRIATIGRIHRAENLAMVRELDLDLSTYEEIDPDHFFGAVLVDTQPGFGHTLLPERIPILAVFDHHVSPTGEDEEEGPPVPHLDVRLGIGATSSVVYEYLRDASCEYDAVVATALFCGIRYDTADLSHHASPLDEEAFNTTFRLADRTAITRIHHPPLPRAYYSELHAALSVARQHGALVLALLGEVPHPEFVAEMADFFLRMKGCSWVVVGGAVEEDRQYVLSLRTDYAFGNAYPLMARVLDGMGSFGGHGHIAGARIDLEDLGESTISSVERVLRQNALGILGSSEKGELPPEGRPLS